MKIITLTTVCIPSDEIVARKIDEDLIIIPLTAGIGDMEDELYTLNETGKAIWDRLDGIQSLGQIINELSVEYEAPKEEIEQDVIGLVTELLRRKMLIQK